jgi:hypothetical protein
MCIEIEKTFMPINPCYTAKVRLLHLKDPAPRGFGDCADLQDIHGTRRCNHFDTRTPTHLNGAKVCRMNISTHFIHLITRQ